jgi:glycosyltransferase involved in cell wall biosynthesis
MKVLFIPYVTNPFFDKLCNGLENFVSTISSNAELFWDSPFSFDIIHIHFPEAFYLWGKFKKNPDPALSAGIFVERLSKLHQSGAIIIWTIHNLEGHNSPFPNLDKMVFNAMVKFSSGIIYQSVSGEKLFKLAYPQAGKKNIITIPHINYIDCYPNKVNRQMARKYLNLPEDSFIYLCFGQIRPYKNINIIIKAFKKISRINKKSILLIAGTPTTSMKKKDLLLLKLSTLFNRKILYFPQYIEDQALQFYLSASDICIFAYTKVFISGSVILAGSFGIPVIAPDMGCLPDYVNKETGFLFKKNDMSSLVEKMINATKCDLKKMGGKAKKIQTKNDFNAIAEKTYQFYSSQLNLNQPQE